MIIVMETAATREQVNDVVARVKALGLGAHLSEGEERTIIGVVGSPLPPTLDDELEIHAGVERVVRITKKYKLTGWDFHPQKTRITVRDVVIGGDATRLMQREHTPRDDDRDRRQESQGERSFGMPCAHGSQRCQEVEVLPHVIFAPSLATGRRSSARRLRFRRP